MAFEKAPPTGIRALKEKAGNEFIGVLVNYEEKPGRFVDEEGNPKNDHVYSFMVETSNFPGMKQGQEYSFAAPTRFHYRMRDWDGVVAGQRFKITYDGDERTKQGGKASNFTILRDNGK